MTFSLFVSWVLPVLALAALGRFAVDTEIPRVVVLETKPPPAAKFKRGRHQQEAAQQVVGQMQQPSAPTPTITPSTSSSSPSSIDDKLSQLPTPYRQVVDAIRRRGRLNGGIDILRDNAKKKKKKKKKSSTASSATSTTRDGSQQQAPSLSSPPSASSSTDRRRPPAPPSGDPERARFAEKIDELRRAHGRDPEDLFAAADYADALRLYELQFHQGGAYEADAIEMHGKVVKMAERRRRRMLDEGKSTSEASGGGSDITSINDEVTIEYRSKSADGLLCALYTNQGKVYYMANMFEKAVESYTKCLNEVVGGGGDGGDDDSSSTSPTTTYLDAVNSRGSAYIILGRYEDAARDLLRVIDQDDRRLFADAFTGLARVLTAQPAAAPPGTLRNVVETTLEPLVEQLEDKYRIFSEHGQSGNLQVLSSALNRLHHVLFTYHDSQTKDIKEAWRHLQDSYRHKMSTLPPWNHGFEAHKVKQTCEIFKEGFWTQDVGSQTKTPIFIIGFVRSGSTLLERVLDAHPLIVGTGENSVFNGRLDEIRNKIVEVSMTGQGHLLGSVTEKLADDVVAEMRRRWEVIDANTEHQDVAESKDPQRFVDKMLTNYYNVGFIQMLYPNALILHVARNPMDTLFSAYKHEFPPGTLDYTSDFKSLAELYHAYRDLIEHWDNVLPGRVTHIRYEDMVFDMPGVARAIIAATGLSWDDSVLDFHRKKHAVNTLSTTQVRKGVYKDSLESWMRYEDELRPLSELIGERVSYDLKTTLPGYTPPPPALALEPAPESSEEQESQQQQDKEEHQHAATEGDPGTSDLEIEEEAKHEEL